jgi:hypothetical protein
MQRLLALADDLETRQQRHCEQSIPVLLFRVPRTLSGPLAMVNRDASIALSVTEVFWFLCYSFPKPKREVRRI